MSRLGYPDRGMPKRSIYCLWMAVSLGSRAKIFGFLWVLYGQLSCCWVVQEDLGRAEVQGVQLQSFGQSTPGRLPAPFAQGL